jgi:hypothetical protein
MDRNGCQGIEGSEAEPCCSFRPRTTHTALWSSSLPPGCREPFGLLPARRWSPRTGLPLWPSWEPWREVRAPSFSPAVPPTCHKQRTPAVSSGQPRSLHEGRCAGRGLPTWALRAERDCMACKGSTRRRLTMAAAPEGTFSLHRSQLQEHGQPLPTPPARVLSDAASDTDGSRITSISNPASPRARA